MHLNNFGDMRLFCVVNRYLATLQTRSTSAADANKKLAFSYSPHATPRRINAVLICSSAVLSVSTQSPPTSADLIASSLYSSLLLLNWCARCVKSWELHWQWTIWYLCAPRCNAVFVQAVLLQRNVLVVLTLVLLINQYVKHVSSLFQWSHLLLQRYIYNVDSPKHIRGLVGCIMESCIICEWKIGIIFILKSINDAIGASPRVALTENGNLSIVFYHSQLAQDAHTYKCMPHSYLNFKY